MGSWVVAAIQAADGCIGLNKVKRIILEGYGRILAWVCKVRKIQSFCWELDRFCFHSPSSQLHWAMLNRLVNKIERKMRSWYALTLTQLSRLSQLPKQKIKNSCLLKSSRCKTLESYKIIRLVLEFKVWTDLRLWRSHRVVGSSL